MIRGTEICPRITITKITISEKEMHLQKEQECGEMSRKTKKCGYRKRILAGVLSAVVALSSVQMPVTAVHAAAWDQNKFSDSLKLRFWNNEKPGVRFYINAAGKPAGAVRKNRKQLPDRRKYVWRMVSMGSAARHVYRGRLYQQHTGELFF